MKILHLCQKKLDKPKLNPLQRVETRWNSELTSLSRTHQIKTELIMSMSELEKLPRRNNNQNELPPDLDSLDWKKIDDLIQVLEPIEYFTRLLSGDEYATASMTIPSVQMVKDEE
jgi:hypothetical protein